MAYVNDISVNDVPLEANLTGDRFGLFVLTVLDTRPNAGGFDDIKVRVEPASLIADPTLVSVLDAAGDVTLEVLPPTADAGLDRTAVAGETVILDGGGSHDRQTGKLLDFDWDLVAAPAGSLETLHDPTEVKPSLTPDVEGDYVVELVVSRQEQTSFDPAEQSSPADQVVISTLNAAPVADAGRDREVDLGETVQLDGAGSFDLDGDALTYSWTLTEAPAGSSAALDDPAAPRPGLAIDLDGDYVAELTVSDGNAASAPAEVALTTGELPACPSPERDLIAGVGETLPLRPGDFGQVIESFDDTELLWCLVARPAGSAATVGEPKAVRPSLTPDQPGIYVVQLKRRGEDGEPKVGTATIDTENLPSDADAGPDPAASVGDTVVLDAAGSTDLNGDPIDYLWSLLQVPLGSAASLDEATALRPSFQVDVAGSYVVQLVTRDASGEAGRPDTLVVDTLNAQPRAKAGADQTVAVQATVQLDGSASSDPDGDTLSFRWTVLEAPDGVGGMLSDPAAESPTFLAHAEGDFLIELVVADGTIESPPDTVLITTGNSRPSADAGSDQEVLPGAPVQLDGTASADVDGDSLTYAWALIHLPAGSTAALDDPASATPSFTLDLAGDYVAQLIVSDGFEPSLPDTVVVSVSNQPPVADAGADLRVPIPQARLVTLDGSDSSDPDGDPLSFAWSFVAIPSGSTAVLGGADTDTPSFVADLAGEYLVQLVVNDGIVDSASDLVTVTADANRPVADAGLDQEVTEGALVNLDGSASSDPEGSPLSFSWRVLFPSGAGAPALTNPTSATPSLTAPAGLAIVELTVNDGAFDSLPDIVAIRGGSAVANTAPLLDPIGPRSVALGTTLTLALTGSDPDGDTIFFGAAPQPLPAGATLDAVVEQSGLPNAGLFSFTPGPGQVGDIALTFQVNDGFAVDSESITITVTGPAPGTLTAFTGRLLDADEEFANPATDLPVVGATVSIGGVSTTSDSAGFFTLTGVAAGSGVLLEIDAGTAVPFPDPVPSGTPYASVNQAIDLIVGVANVEDDPFFLMRAPAAIEVAVNPTGTTIVENPGLPGVSVEVPQGATTAATLSVSEIPAALAPASLPASILPCQVVKVLPFGTAFSPAASITLPNNDNLPVGTDVDLWGLDPATGLFRVLGQGTVASATEISATGLLTEATFLFAVPRAPGSVAAADENPLTRTPRALADGNVFRSITLPSYRSLGVARALTFVYNSTAADARPIVGAEVTFPTSTGLPPLIESRLEVGGIEVAGPVFTSTTTALDPSDPGLEEGQTVRLAHSFDAGSFPTGSYPTRTTATADFGCSKVSAVAAGRIVIDNQQASPFGNGWSLAGLQRITEQPDGRLVLEEGDGRVKVFEPGSSVDVEGEITQLPEPPLDVRIGALEDDEDLLLFNEQLGLELPSDITFNAIAPGFYNSNSQLQNLTLPAGAIVNSHYVHFDPLGTPGSPVLRQGTAVFPDDLIGVITRSPQLNATDALLGSPTTIYPTNAFQRGLELGVTSASDQITIGRDLRTLVLDNRTINRIDSIRVLTVPRGPSLAISRFETSGEDWTVSGGTNVSGPDREAAGGNPGGRLSVTGDGRFFWSAPESFLQGLASAHNGRLAYDPRLLDDSFLETVSEDLILSGAGLTVTYSLPYRPVDDVWTRVNLLLHEGAGWVLQGTSQAPTQAELESILADATELLIRADYRNVPGTTAYLDNVALTAQPIIGLAFASPPGDFSLLAKNVDGSFTRTLKNGTRLEFDSDGKLVALVDRNGNTTGMDYNGDDTLQSVSDPADPSRLVSLAYLNGQLASVTDVIGRITAFGVNDTGDLASVTLPDDSQRRYAYDQNGRLVNEASARFRDDPRLWLRRAVHRRRLP